MRKKDGDIAVQYLLIYTGSSQTLMAYQMVHPKNHQKKKAMLINNIALNNGGSAEIRTLEPFRVAGFQDRCLQPLGHTSGMRRTINIPVRHVKTECVRLREKQAKFL